MVRDNAPSSDELREQVTDLVCSLPDHLFRAFTRFVGTIPPGNDAPEEYARKLAEALARAEQEHSGDVDN